MVDTMSFMVPRGKLPAGSILYIVAGAIGGLALGIGAALIHWLLRPPEGVAWFVLALAAAGGLRDVLWPHLRLPAREVQVDELLRRETPWWVYLPAYSFALAIGVLTRIPFAGFLVLISFAAYVGAPMGVVAGVLYGIARSGTTVALAAFALLVGRESVTAAMAKSQRPARLASGATQFALLAAGLAATGMFTS